MERGNEKKNGRSCEAEVIQVTDWMNEWINEWADDRGKIHKSNLGEWRSVPASVCVCVQEKWMNKCSMTEREKDWEREKEDLFRQRGHTPVAVIEVWAN